MPIVEEAGRSKESYPEGAKRIETELTDRIQKIHELMGHIPSGHLHEALKREERNRQIGRFHRIIADLTVIASDFENLFREIPPNYYLELEISHNGYSGLTRSEYPFARAERVDNTLRYFVDCGIFIGSSQGRSVAVIKAAPAQGDYLLPFLMLKPAGTGILEEKHLNLRNISNAKVDRIPGAFKPITVLPSSPIYRPQDRIS